MLCFVFFSCESGEVMGGDSEDTGGGEEETCTGENCCPENFVESSLTTSDEQICLPESFNYINTTQLTDGYGFNNVIIDGIQIDNDDWVGAFNGSICVGSIKWDLAFGCDEICFVPTYGSVQNNDGYMTSGVSPTFKIYDTSDNIYYDATPTENYNWVGSGFNIHIAASLAAISN